MNFFFKRLAGLGWIALILFFSIAVALLKSRGSVSLAIWGVGILFAIVFGILWIVFKSLKRQNAKPVGITLFIQSLIVFILSFLIGGNDETFGYSDVNRRYFLGKTYDKGMPGFDSVEKFISLVTWGWSICLLSTLTVVFVSLFIRSAQELEPILRESGPSEVAKIKKQDQRRLFKALQVVGLFVGMVMISSNFPVTQDPYRSGIDKGFIFQILWLLFIFGIVATLSSKKPLKYPVLIFSYLSIGVLSVMVAYFRTKDLYGVRYGTDITVLKSIGLASIVLVIGMLFYSALRRPKEQKPGVSSGEMPTVPGEN